MDNQHTQKTKTLGKDLLTLSLIISIFFGIFLGTRPLSVPDEGRYTEIPREMLVTDDFVTPRLNGVKYFEKPPLMYWLTVGSLKTFGVNEWALRFWPALFALFGALGTYLFGRRFYNRETGIASALILSSTLLYYAHSRILILDMQVSSFLTLTLFSFFAAVFEKNKQRKRLFLAGFFTFSAAALMTKGLLGIALPGCIILIWAFAYKKGEALKLAFNPWGILWFFALALPWHLLAHLKNPAFFETYIIHEQITRFLTSVHKRVQPFWFFVPIVLVGLFPWVGFLPKAIKNTYQSIKEKSPTHLVDSFLVIWICFIFVFFSTSSSKLIPYIVPIFPPLALLLGQVVVKAWHSTTPATYQLSFKIFKFFTICLILAAPIFLYIEHLLDNELVTTYVFMSLFVLILGFIISTVFTQVIKDPYAASGFDVVQPHTRVTPAIFIGALISDISFPRKGNIKILILTLGLTAALMYIPLNKAWVHLEGRSIYPLAMAVKKRLEPKDLVISWHRYYQDLPPYVERINYVVDHLTEMGHGATLEDVTAWMLSEEGFADLLKTGKPFYLVTRKSFLEEMYKHHPTLKNLQIIARSGKNILLTNKQ